LSVAPARPWRFISLLVCVVAFSLTLSPVLLAQDDGSLDPAADASPAPASAIPSKPALRDVSPAMLPANFLHDQENLWLFPRELAQGRRWASTITVAAATLGLLSADPHVQPYFAQTTAFRGFDRAFGSRVTGVETIAIPAALYVTGLDLHDSYMEKTALFAAESIADVEVIRAVLNSVTNRWRPQDIFSRRSYSNTFFHSVSHVGSSFPSGHTIVAVSVATIIARRYRSHRWVPWVAYGLAGTIAFSRITLRAHFPSDVFLGTVLGYAIARYDVLQNQ
jgi:PAP2 superfamily